MVWGIVLTVISAIGTGIYTAYQFTKDVTLEVLTWARWFIDTTFKSFPKPLKIFLFLFILVTFGGFMVSLFLHFNYACANSNDLRETNSPFAGVLLIKNSIQIAIENEEELEQNETWDEAIEKYTHLADLQNPKDNPFWKVRCIENSPRLTIKGLDFLNYKIWVLLFVIFYLVRFLRRGGG